MRPPRPSGSAAAIGCARLTTPGPRADTTRRGARGTGRARSREKASVHAYQPERGLRTSDVTTAVRRVSGPVADELYVLCRPDSCAADPARQAASVYEALCDALAAEGAGREFLVSETVFLRRIRTDLEVVRSARARVLGSAGLHPATTFIGQPPLDPDAHLELAAVPVLPRAGDASWTHAVSRSGACPCEACAPGARATVVRLSGQIHLHAGNVYGTGRDAYEEAYDMFRVAEALLGEAGMTFANVMRTWIHLRGIDRDYVAFNRARREFFGCRGIERRPASTGIQGGPFPDTHAFSLSLYAVKSPTPLDVAPISTPLLSEAWDYGSDFSRGLRLADANKVALHVSGTASIDEDRKSVV